MLSLWEILILISQEHTSQNANKPFKVSYILSSILVSSTLFLLSIRLFLLPLNQLLLHTHLILITSLSPLLLHMTSSLLTYSMIPLFCIQLITSLFSFQFTKITFSINHRTHILNNTKLQKRVSCLTKLPFHNGNFLPIKWILYLKQTQSTNLALYRTFVCLKMR